MQKVFTNISDVIKSGYRSNAFAPYVWFTGVTVPILFVAGFFTDGIIQPTLFGLGCFVILFAMVMYLLIFLKDPKLLQSEGFRLEDRKLDIIQQKGGKVILNPVDLTPPKSLQANLPDEEG